MASKKVYFATGNVRKIAEANATLQSFDVTVEPVKLAFDEIQHVDPVEITKAKARSAYALLGKPVVVSDTSWAIPALGGFPGGYMKDVSAWLQPQDWLDLMSRHEDRRILCHEHVVYYDGKTVTHFMSEYVGRIIHEARGRDHDEESIEKVTILYGDKTMAEQLAEGDIASAGEELAHWKQFGQWYKNL